MRTYEEWEATARRRYDRQGLVEHFCEHGVGHPNPGSALWIAQQQGSSTAVSEDVSDEDRRKGILKRWEAQMVHGCDGCCGEETFPSMVDSLMRTHDMIMTYQNQNRLRQ